MRLVYLIFFILSVNLASGAVANNTAPKVVVARVVQYDTAVVNTRYFDKNSINKYRKQPDFQYKEAKENFSWWDRFWAWFWDWLAHLISFRGASWLAVIWTIVELLLISGGVVALIYFILRSAGVDVRNVFSRKSAAAPIPHSEFIEDINTIDFDAEIENAVAKLNYRFAVRLLYLKCLKQLSDSGLISWQIDKTNHDYIDELRNDAQKRAFGLLTMQFEYVWYGEFSIDAQVYKNIDLSFRDFNKRAS